MPPTLAISGTISPDPNVPALQAPIQGFALALILAPGFVTGNLQIKLFNKFMQIFINRI